MGRAANLWVEGEQLVLVSVHAAGLLRDSLDTARWRPARAQAQKGRGQEAFKHFDPKSSHCGL